MSTEEWTVVDHANDDNQRSFATRERAEKAVATVSELGGEPLLVPPGDDVAEAIAATTDQTAEKIREKSETIELGHPAEAQVVDVEPAPEADTEAEAANLPERSVADDPLTWMPSDFVDTIDGSPAINRKGFEVLAHFYDVSTTSTLQVAPEETEHQYCRVKATATIGDRTVEAFGSAHVDRGDDKTLLLEMADTRARKRAISIATGVGAVAVEELRSEAQEANP